MRTKLYRGIVAILLLQAASLCFSPPAQEFPAKKPKYDYLSSYLSRNTKPLGLEEDQALRRLLKQPKIKWAIRAGMRHILD